VRGVRLQSCIASIVVKAVETWGNNTTSTWHDHLETAPGVMSTALGLGRDGGAAVAEL
jgi:hypothetical protein